MRTEPPHTILGDRYVLEDEIGHGDTGTVWRAVDRVLDRTVAVKVLHPHLARDPTLTGRFAEAARAAAGVSHPGIARVLDTGADGGVVFIVTEFVEGESLRERITREGAVDPDRAASLQRQVLAALGAAHRAGVLHLDVKPENVLIGSDGRVRLTDAGLAHAAGTHRGPEDPRADVRAAGAVLYEMLTGTAPAEGGGGLLPPRAFRPGIPRGLDAAAMRALSGRFATADEFAGALPPHAEEEPGAMRRGVGDAPAGGPSPSPPLAPDGGSWFRSWMLVPLLVVIGMGAAIGVGLWVGRLEVGGPLGVRPRPAETPTPRPAVLPVAGVSAFDPFGDRAENDGGLPLAVDGDPATAWRSENYFDGRLNKPGVGLLFDLGSTRTVTGFRLLTPAPGFRFRVLVGDDPPALIATGGPSFTSAADIREAIGPASGRYVLLWITTVVPTNDGNRAEVAEFKVLGEGG